MKYYISDLKVFEIEKMKTSILKDCIKTCEEFILIFSLNGIFKTDINSNKIQKLAYKDHIVKEVKIGNYHFLEDNSTIDYKDISQIPLEHFSKKIRKETYMLRENGLLMFVIIKDKLTDDILDFYFDVVKTSTIDNIFVIQDLDQYLSFKQIKKTNNCK